MTSVTVGGSRVMSMLNTSSSRPLLPKPPPFGTSTRFPSGENRKGEWGVEPWESTSHFHLVQVRDDAISIAEDMNAVRDLFAIFEQGCYDAVAVGTDSHRQWYDIYLIVSFQS